MCIYIGICVYIYIYIYIHSFASRGICIYIEHVYVLYIYTYSIYTQTTSTSHTHMPNHAQVLALPLLMAAGQAANSKHTEDLISNINNKTVKRKKKKQNQNYYKTPKHGKTTNIQKQFKKTKTYSKKQKIKKYPRIYICLIFI